MTQFDGDCSQFRGAGHRRLVRFWLGHANRSITDAYNKLKEDAAFRKKLAEQVGIGFELPDEKLEVAPNCTQSELLSPFDQGTGIKEEEWLPELYDLRTLRFECPRNRPTIRLVHGAKGVCQNPAAGF